jgi:predicted anti-sigma-YlaC factor YlaD
VTNIWHRIRGGRRDEPGLTCNQFVELVTSYFEGTLTDVERQRFEEHLGVCAGCTNYLDQLRETIVVVGRIEPDDLTPEMKGELLSAFSGWPRD